MSFEEILKMISIPLELTVIVLTVLHLRSEIRKNKNPDHLSQDYHPTFRSIVLTLFLIIIGTFLILQYENPQVFQIIGKNLHILWIGLKCTFLVSIVAIFFGSVVGILAALIITKEKDNILLTLLDSSVMSIIYILLGIPALVLLYLIYYSGFNVSVFTASAIALSINLSPFVAKIVAASIKNISQEQIDSAIAFGYSPKQITRYFKVGFVAKTSIQPLLVEYYTTIKLSSLAGLISLVEIYHVSQDIIKDTQDPISSYIILSICYVIVVTPIAVLVDYMEHRWRIK